jgi:type II secretory pathway component PulF
MTEFLEQVWAWILEWWWILIVILIVVGFAVFGARSPAQKNLDRRDPFSGDW